MKAKEELRGLQIVVLYRCARCGAEYKRSAEARKCYDGHEKTETDVNDS